MSPWPAPILAPFLVAVACNGGNGESSGDGPPSLGLERVATGLSRPVLVTVAPGETSRLFVVEKTGRVRILRDGTLLPTPFLDLSGLVSSGSEQGLLGLAFPPDFETSGVFYVDYTNLDGDSRVARHVVTANPDVADPTGQIILAVDQPFANHNGGGIAFGPDGFLYVGFGDGGAGGDPNGNGQNAGTLLGTILRIDPSQGPTYAIPPGNPFVGVEGARGEVWVFGLRNPWRFSFDRSTGDILVGDVGQNAREEIDLVPAGTGGGNYGWNVLEGSSCFSTPDCDPSSFVAPLLDYTHDEGCSVTGGHVYRGNAISGLRGHYFYGDYCSGFVRSFRLDDGVATGHREWPELAPGGSITSFGEDTAGELYIVIDEGAVFRVVAAN